MNQCYHVLPVFKELQRPGTNILGRPGAGVRNLASLRCGLRCLHTKGKQADTVLQYAAEIRQGVSAQPDGKIQWKRQMSGNIVNTLPGTSWKGLEHDLTTVLKSGTQKPCHKVTAPITHVRPKALPFRSVA